MQGKKIVLIDDDENILTAIAQQFTDAGAIIAEKAASYEAGLLAIKNNAPDVAVVDLMLPHHSGLDLVKEARALSPNTFFVILTNSINAENVADALEANVTMFVQKADHDPAEIVQMVANRFK